MANLFKYGPAIGHLREQNGMTKGELARHLLVLPKDIDRLENGTLELSYAQINYAANTFGVDFNLLCNGEIKDAVTDEFIKKELEKIWDNLAAIKDIIAKIEIRMGIKVLPDEHVDEPLSETVSEDAIDESESILRPIL